MKQKLFYLLALLPVLSLFSACGGDDEDDVFARPVIVKDDGTTSNGSKFSAIDDKNFYLDYIKYSVEEGHLVVSGYDGAGFKGVAKIASGITYKGKTYEVLSIGYEAFRHCTGLTSITLPNSITSIGACAFIGCTGLTSVTIPESVTSIGGQAFSNCTGLTSITIPNSVTSIGDGAFEGCKSLSSVTIPNSVTNIGCNAFSGCSGLTSITIPNSVTSIGGGTFSGCSGLTSITIPNSVTSIGNYAFNGSGLAEVTCKAKTPPILSGYMVFTNISPDAKLYVPIGSGNAYKNSDWKSSFKQENIIEKEM